MDGAVVPVNLIIPVFGPRRASLTTQGRLEQKIAKFAKQESEVPFAAFAAFCSIFLFPTAVHDG